MTISHSGERSPRSASNPSKVMAFWIMVLYDDASGSSRTVFFTAVTPTIPEYVNDDGHAEFSTWIIKPTVIRY